MVDKALFAEIINRRLTQLEQSAAWMSRKVGVSGASISRWRNDLDDTLPQDREHVHALAEHLQLDDEERGRFFAAAGLVWEPSQTDPAPPPLTDAERTYLAVLRHRCNRLPLAEDDRASSLHSERGQPPRPSLANVYIDLATQTPPTVERILDRLNVPADERAQALEKLKQYGHQVGKNVTEYVEWKGIGERGNAMELPWPKDWKEHPFKQWASGESSLKAAYLPLSALEALTETQHLVLLGDPGSGKSTLVNHLAYVLAGALLEKESHWSHILEDRLQAPLFPLRIVARRWSGSLNEGAAAGIERVYEALAALSGGMELTEIKTRLHSPDTLVMFDGLDEAPVAEHEEDYDRRRVLLDSVIEFAAAHPRCRVLVTSRIRPYQTPGYQLPGWTTSTLAPLDDPRIERFVNRWYEEVRRVEGMEAERARELAGQLQGAIQRRDDLHEMAGIPLLLTMLALVNKRYGLPENRAELYSQCTEQLLWEWEKAKAEEGKTQSLHHLLEEIDPRRTRQDVEKVLWRQTFEAHRLSGKRDADLKVRDLREALAETPPQRSENWAWADRLVRFMQQRGGLLTAVDDHTFTFPHRSFQEYLAARWLIEIDDMPEFAADLLRSESKSKMRRGTRGKGRSINYTAADLWREVVLLACGHLATNGPSSLWRMLVDELGFAVEEDPELWQGAIIAGIALLEYGPEKVSGRIGRRLRDDLPATLTRLMQNPTLPPESRLEAGLLAADLGALPTDLDALIPVAGLDYPCRIGKYPVANAQYWRFRDIRLSDDVRYNHATQPVIAVTWNEAMEYCQWLGEQWRAEGVIGRNEAVRLPTEEEWLAAGGSHTYAWGDEFDASRCNSRESGLAQPSPVHMYPAGATPDGVHDLCGNVWEWMMNEHEYGEGSRALRGGSWARSADGVSLAARHYWFPWNRDDDWGFRVVVVPRSS